MILNIVHSLITEKNSNEVRLSGRFGIFITIIACCLGLLICSDGRANEVVLLQDGNELICFSETEGKRVPLYYCE